MANDNSDLILETLLELKQGQGEIKGALEATTTSNKARFEAIESSVSTNNKQQWIATACVLPVVGALHFLGSKIGLIRS